MNEKREWATVVIQKGKGGRGRIVNDSQRGLFSYGSVYYNHRLKAYPEGSRLNVVFRLSRMGRRMVREIRERSLQDVNG